MHGQKDCCCRSHGVDTRFLRTGAALTAGGVLLASTGTAMVAAAVASAARQWVGRHHPRPAARATATARRAAAAARAGREAWHGSGVEYPG